MRVRSADMANSIVLQVSLFCVINGVESLLKFVSPPIKLPKCVPSDTAKGICVVCICNIDGVFICRAVKCVKPEKPALIDKFECKANITYKKDHTVCRCSFTSQWISDSCRQIFRTMKSDRFLTLNYLNQSLTCKPNALYLVDCNICQCNNSGFIQGSLCTSRTCNNGTKADTCKFGDVLRTNNEICLCSDVNFYIDTLCTKIGPKFMQELNAANVRAVTDMKYKAHENCTPHKEYYNDCNHCICDDNKEMVCTKKVCQPRVLRSDMKKSMEVPSIKTSFSKHTNKHLPEILEFESCVPGQLYRADCNTCRCSRNSTLMCTKMACVDQVYVKTMNAHNNKSHHKHKSLTQSKVGARRGESMLHGNPETEETGSCVPGKFYQKMCQSCFCNHQKTLNCTGSCDDKLSLKKSWRPVKSFPFKPGDIHYFPVLYHLSDKCEPGKMYRISCNGCVCQESNNLVCENKLCISDEAMTKLEAKNLSGNKCDKDEKHGCVHCACENNISKCKALPQCDERERLSSNQQKVPLSLNVKKEKCIPGMMYTVQCNRCYCQQDSTLRCTQKACLNYAQAQKLHQQQEYLEEHGL